MSPIKLIRKNKPRPLSFYFILSGWIILSVSVLLFFLSDYSKNLLLTRKSLYIALQGSPDQALDLFSSLTRQNRLFASQDYFAYRLSSQSVDIRSAFLRNPHNLTYLIQYSNHIHSSRDWVQTDNYFHQLPFARFLSEKSGKYANSQNPQDAKKGLFFMVLAKKTLDDATTNNQLGMLFNNRYHAYQKGLPLLQESLQLRPRQIDTYTYFGDVYLRTKRTALSRSYYTLANRLNPTSYPTYLQISQTLINEKKYREALPYLARAHIFIPDHLNSYFQLATFYVNAGENLLGEAVFKEFLTKNPLNAEARYYYGLFLKRIENESDAMTQFTLSIALDPTFEKSFWERANLYIQLEHWEKALKDLDQAIYLNPTNQNYLHRRKWVEEQQIK